MVSSKDMFEVERQGNCDAFLADYNQHLMEEEQRWLRQSECSSEEYRSEIENSIENSGGYWIERDYVRQEPSVTTFSDDELPF